MLNIGGGELMVIALIGLIALGPEQLPAMMRKTGAFSARVRGMKDELIGQFVAAAEERTGDPEANTTTNKGSEQLTRTTNGP